MKHMHFGEIDSNWYVLIICLQISLLSLLHGPQEPLSVLGKGYWTIATISFNCYKGFSFSYRVLKEDEFSIKYTWFSRKDNDM